jgi:hypothetical protein
MNPSTGAVSPLRQRMLDDMRMRKLEPKTQSAYVPAVRKLAAFLRRPPDTADARVLSLEGLSSQGAHPLQDDDAASQRVHASLPAARASQRVPPHPPLRPAGQRAPAR